MQRNLPLCAMGRLAVRLITCVLPDYGIKGGTGAPPQPPLLAHLLLIHLLIISSCIRTISPTL